MQTSDLLGVINSQVADLAHDWDTVFPARVIRVNSLETLSVDVQMMVYREDNDGDVTDDTPILAIPVVMPSSSTSMISFPVNVGDIVLCVVSQTSLDNFKMQTNNLSTVVNDRRRFNAQDAIAIPGLFPSKLSMNDPAKRSLAHNPKDTTITHNIGTALECKVTLGSDGNILMESPFTITQKCRDFKVDSETISLKATSMTVDVATTNWTGNNTISGTWTFNGIPFDFHKHVGITPGSGVSGLPTA